MVGIPLDLKRCLRLLARRWRVVLGVALAFTALGLGVGLLLLVTAPTYTAEALVLIAKPRYSVELESKIRSNQDPVVNAAMSSAMLKARGDTLVILARAPGVESAVQRRLATQLGPRDLQPDGLVRRIGVRSAGEVLRISARASDPRSAADLANTWAEEVTRQVDSLYGASAGSEAIDAEVERTRQQYEVADRALSQFAIENPVDDLSRRTQAKADEIQIMEAQRVGLVKTRAAGVFGAMSAVDQLIRDAETLRKQLEQPSGSAAGSLGDGLAVMMLRARNVLTTSSNLADVSPPQTDSKAAPAPDVRPQRAPAAVANVQVSASDLGGDKSTNRDDLDALIQALRTRQVELQAEATEQAQLLKDRGDPAKDPLDAAIVDAYVDLHKMQADLAELTRQREALSNQRTVLGTSLTSLVNKSQELRVAKATAGSDGGTVAVRAFPSAVPSSPNLLLYTLLGGGFGFLLGCALALRPAVGAWLKNLVSMDIAPHPSTADETVSRTAVT